ncbi:hypothetical protein ACTRXD_11925 [Nitrospira sp. T9]|uniref:hypothetical protein n=1 Tax=unclassified Nitrospira TaxID=2652172 RepID=UPI003F9E9D9A
MNAVPVCSPWLLCISFLAVGLTTPVTSVAECNPVVATVVAVQGRVEVRRVNVEQWRPVSLDDIFCAGDRIRVGDRSRADIALANRAVLRLTQNTAITLGGIQKEKTVPVFLIESATDVFTRGIRAIMGGLVGIRDTQTEISIFEGKGVVAKDEGTFSLTGRESVVSAKGQALV